MHVIKSHYNFLPFFKQFRLSIHMNTPPLYELLPLLTQTVSYPALRRYSLLQLRRVFLSEPPLDIKGISAFQPHAYPCRKESKGLMRIYSRSSLFSFLTKAAQAGAWISSRSPKLKRERQQLVAGTNEAFAEFVRSSFPLPSLTERRIIMNRRGKEKRNTAVANLFAKGSVLFSRRRSRYPAPAVCRLFFLI